MARSTGSPAARRCVLGLPAAERAGPSDRRPHGRRRLDRRPSGRASWPSTRTCTPIPSCRTRRSRRPQRIAEELTKAGAKVTTGVGKLGVVGVLENGPGPVVLVRTDMDALPVVEETGLPYASKVDGARQAGPRRRRDARLRPRHAHDLLHRHGAVAGRAQGPLVAARWS